MPIIFRYGVRHYYLYSVFLGLFCLGLICGNNAFGEEIVEDNTVPSPPPTISAKKQFLDTPIFKEIDQEKVLLTPFFDDSSTNIAFYIECPSIACPDDGTTDSPIYIFSAETLGQGSKTFSEYWAPPVLTNYIAIEYKNDEQQFTCSDKTIEECKNDTHFISLFEFALVSDNTEINTEMLATKNKHLEIEATISTTTPASEELTKLSIVLTDTSITSNLEDGQIVTAILDGKSASTTTIEPSAELMQLSIAMSTPSITSNLEDGQIVTAILDEKPSVINNPTAESTEPEETDSDNSFLRDVIDSAIEFFTADAPETTNTSDITSVIQPELESEQKIEPSDELMQLSIAMSTPSITSNLEDGQIITAILDEKPSVVTNPTTESTDPEQTNSNDSFLRDVIDSAIEFFSSDTPKTPETSDISDVTTFIEPVVESEALPPTEEPTTETETTSPTESEQELEPAVLEKPDEILYEITP